MSVVSCPLSVAQTEQGMESGAQGAGRKAEGKGVSIQESGARSEIISDCGFLTCLVFRGEALL
jgi:hypothetical protein